MHVLLVATYEMGRQPFGLASPAAWLESGGHRVRCIDLSREPLSENAIRRAELIAFHLPMHTATRLAAPVIQQVRALSPAARIACYGLYAPLNEEYLRQVGADFILGGEFEAALLRLANGGTASGISLERLQFRKPDRSLLPRLDAYAKLQVGSESRIAGYTEASRGCKHLCRHCPVVPVYRGVFRVVQAEIVLADIRAQVAVGAQHITFGDPDFFNGPGHARRIVEQLHREFPGVTYDATIKIEHLRRNAGMLPFLRDTGCLFVTSAVESVDDAVLGRLQKGHTRADFVAVVEEFDRVGLALAPTFIAFTPWTTVEGYRNLLRTIAGLGLVDAVSPVQLALRLLITAGSRLLELDDIRGLVEGFDQAGLLYRWRHPQPEVDALAAAALKVAAREAERRELFRCFWELADAGPVPENFDLLPRAAVPYLNEPWYC